MSPKNMEYVQNQNYYVTYSFGIFFGISELPIKTFPWKNIVSFLIKLLRPRDYF